MAERLRNFTFRTLQTYPWGRWFDGSIWKLTKGEDFNTPVPHMRAVIYQAALRLEGKARVSVSGGVIVLQFTPVVKCKEVVPCNACDAGQVPVVV